VVHKVNWLILLVVSLLAVIQIPLDLRTYRLSRRTTVASLTAIVVLITVSAQLTGSYNRLIVSFALSTLVVSTYGVVHKSSDGALGRGDVLLVAPLGLAIAYVDKSAVLTWQLIATSSAALHAIVLKVKSGTPNIPFGPHLLISSLIVLISSL